MLSISSTATTLPEAMTGQIYLEDGWEFQDGLTVKPAVSGEYAIVKK